MTGTTGELEEFVVSVVRAMAKALKGCSISQGVLTKQWLELNWAHASRGTLDSARQGSDLGPDRARGGLRGNI